MKKIRQIFTAALAVVFAFQLCGCSSGTADEKKEDSSAQAAVSVESVSETETETVSGEENTDTEGTEFASYTEDDEDLYVDFEIIGTSTGSVINAYPDEAPFMAASLAVYDENYESRDFDTLDISVSVYRFKNMDDYKTALENYYEAVSGYTDSENAQEKDPASGLAPEHVCDLAVKAEPDKETDEISYYSSGIYYFDFPESLDEGWYEASFTVNIEGKDYTAYRLIQSTPLSLSSYTAAGRYIAWLHDGMTGKAAEDAEITVSGEYEASGDTDEDGCCSLEIQNGDYSLDHSFITAEWDGHIYCDLTGYTGFSSSNSLKNRYYSYLISDRNIYMSDDELLFYGLIRNRSLTDNGSPEDITVVLCSYDDDIETAEVELNENGSFTGSISIEDLEEGYYELRLRIGGAAVYSLSGIRITDYVKPVYTGSASSEKIAYMTEKEDEQQAAIDLELSYYDGTAAKGFELSEIYNTAAGTDGSTITIGDDGTAEDTFDIAKAASHSSWKPVEEYVEYSGSDAEDENVYLDCNYYVLPADVMIEGKNDAGSKTFTFGTWKITTDNLRNSSDIFNYDLLKGEVCDVKVTAELYRNWWEKVETGTGYDKIYRTSYPIYEYVEHTDLLDTYEAQTENGTGSIRYDFGDDNEELHASYYLDCSYEDSFGNTVTQRFYLYTRAFCYRYDSGSYTMMPVDTESGEEEDDLYGSYRFHDGEDSDLYLACDYEKYEMKDEESLFTLTVLTDGSVYPSVSEDGTLHIPFEEALIPNFTVYGFIFDGRYTRPLTGTSMAFDYNDRALELTVRSSEEEYEPGDEAVVNVGVKESISGDTVKKGTEVLISVVDEAIFDLEEQDALFLKKLYASKTGPSVTSYISISSELQRNMKLYAYDEVSESAEAMSADSNAASDNGQVRSDFKDTAFFATGYTDEDGNVSFTFKLPDNTTTWRVTALAVTEDNFAGDGTGSVTASLPYFVDPITNETILEGESYTIGLRSAGRDVSTEDACSYTVTVKGDDVSETVSAESGGIRELAFAEFDGLKEGEYTVTVTGECSGFSDSAEYSFEVIKSGLEIKTAVTSKVSDGIDIDPVRYPVSLWIYNKNARTYNAILGDLLCSRGIRADERIGYYIALKIISENDPDGYFSEELEEQDLDDLSVSSGYMKLFADSEGSRELTALAYLAAPKIADPEEILDYYPEYAEENTEVSDDIPYEEDPAWLLLQAAATGETDTDRIKELLEDAPCFKSAVYLNAALYLSGNEEEAKNNYESLVSSTFKQAKAVSGETGYYIEADDGGSLMDNTAAALMLSSLMGMDEADGFAVYMSEKDSDEDIYPIQKAVYLLYAKEKVSEKESVSYTLDGERQTADINNYSGLHLVLTHSELEALDLKAEEGEPYMTVFYSGNISEAGKEENNLIKVSASFDRESYKVGDTALYRIDVDLSAFDTDMGSSAVIVDVYVPSGMRFNRYTPDDYGENWYLVSREGQRLRYVLYGTGEEDQASIEISCSCAAPGDYIAEQVYVSSACSDIYGLSERETLSIKE